MKKSKVTKSICVLLALIIMVGIIGGAAPVLGTQTVSDTAHYSELTEHSDYYIESENFEETAFQSELLGFLDFDDTAEANTPVIYEWICPSLPMFGYDPEIDPVDFSDLGMMAAVASNQVTATFRGNGNTGGQVPADIIINTPGTLVFPPRGNLVRTGHTFGGWRHAIPNGILYAPGATYQFSAERSGTFTLEAYWIPSQDLPHTLTINPSSDWPGVSNAGSIHEVTVTTNQDSWNVSSDSDWLGFSRTFGTSGQSVRIYAQQNNMASERTATVTFTAGSAPLRQITVTQLAGTGTGTTPPTGVTLTFRHNDGTNGSSPLTRTPGTPMGTLPATPSRQGFTFNGWWTTSASTGGTMITVATTVPNAATQYWARWTAWPNVIVTFNPDGGILAADGTREVQQGLEVGLLPTPTRSGHIFAGWFTQRTGGERVTEETIVLGNVEYWARWTLIPTVTVTFNPNGGSIPGDLATMSVRQGSTLGNTPSPNSRPYATFVGWYTQRTGGERVNTNRTINGNVTFWARWNVSITFRSNGGSAVTPRDVIIGNEIGPLPTPTRSGYRFAGWFTASTGGTRIMENTIMNRHNTYWAGWIRDPLRLTGRIRFDTSITV